MNYLITLYTKEGGKQLIGPIDLQTAKTIKGKMEQNKEVFNIQEVDEDGDLTDANI